MSFDPSSELERLRQVVRAYDDDQESTTEREANLFAATRATELVRGPEVLVLGAATGAWAPALLERFGRFETVDAVSEAVAALEERYGDAVRGHVALFEEFAPERRYDTVVMGHVLEHLFDPVEVLRRAKSWLEPTGRVLILVPNADSLHRLVGVQMGLLESANALSAGDHLLGHRRVYDRHRLRQDVEAAGLRVEHMGGLILKPLSNRQMDEWSAELRMAYFELGASKPEQACILCCVAVPVEAALDE